MSVEHSVLDAGNGMVRYALALLVYLGGAVLTLSGIGAIFIPSPISLETRSVLASNILTITVLLGGGIGLFYLFFRMTRTESNPTTIHKAYR